MKKIFFILLFFLNLDLSYSQNSYLNLPPGFKAIIVAKNIGPARHIALRKNGDLFVRLRAPFNKGSIVALRDTNKDLIYDDIQYFESEPGTGIHIHEPFLYYSTDTKVYRKKFKNIQEFIPSGKKEIVVSDFPNQSGHAAKAFTFDPNGNLYVNVGAPSNACQKNKRTRGSPGQLPCPELQRQAGIWQFPANKTNMKQMDSGKRYATGLRNIVALDWSTDQNSLFVVQHGRDQLHSLFPQYYSTNDNAKNPAEELLKINEGFVGGWPYTYYDSNRNQRMIAPEYGGDGKKPAPKGKYPEPIFAFPAHFAPNDLLFYQGNQFPKKYQGGAFIAFHGSWNRAPHDQEGYQVVFLDFQNEKPEKNYEVFADGFSQVKHIKNPQEAKHRPMGLAESSDGSLYIADSVKGFIWCVNYQPQ